MSDSSGPPAQSAPVIPRKKPATEFRANSIFPVISPGDAVLEITEAKIGQSVILGGRHVCPVEIKCLNSDGVLEIDRDLTNQAAISLRKLLIDHAAIPGPMEILEAQEKTGAAIFIPEREAQKAEMYLKHLMSERARNYNDGPSV